MSRQPKTETPNAVERIAAFIDAVHEIDSRPISHLMGLLAEVRPAAVYPTTHPGIQ